MEDKTKSPSNKIQIKSITAVFEEEFRIKARAIVFEEKSDWSQWSKYIDPNDVSNEDDIEEKGIYLYPYS